MSKPTFAQVEHFWKLVAEGKITRANMQAYLEDSDRFITSFPTTIDNTVGLINLIKAALGPNNEKNINPDITPERFKLGEGVREVNLELASFLDGETGEQAAKRLVDEGYTLEGTGELAQFMADNPEEVEKYFWVVALSEAVRWAFPDGDVLVPYARVRGADRCFFMGSFRSQFYSGHRVLVSRRSK